MDIPQAGHSKDCQKDKIEEELSEDELENRRLESSGLCLVHRNFTPVWLSTLFPESSFIPQVENQVSLRKSYPRIYDQESGQMIGMMVTHFQHNPN